MDLLFSLSRLLGFRFGFLKKWLFDGYSDINLKKSYNLIMDPKLLRQLRIWRAEQARLEGVEAYRVLPNATLDALCLACPANKEELLAIKGIKEAKYRKYGKKILEILGQGIEKPSLTSRAGELMLKIENQKVGQEERERTARAIAEPSEMPITVSEFLDGLNTELSGMAARIQGEVSSVDERGKAVYFSLKDEQDQSTLSCFIWANTYRILDVHLAIGDKVIVEGYPSIYKPSGRFSLQVGVIELAGEGALKKAYDALKAKCAAQGLFAEEKKRPLPEFPERIALITSEQGAAIGDFTTNLGRLGLRIDFYPTSVEGKKAVFEILEAIRFFNQYPERYDLLVMIRGGGSLESLQAFNNEALICAVADSKIPTLLGIGHEKDVPLATLAADVAVSTPTAAARTIREPWERAREKVLTTERHILSSYGKVLIEAAHRIEIFSHNLLALLEQFAKRFQFLREKFLQEVPKIQFRLEYLRERLGDISEALFRNFYQVLKSVSDDIERCEKTILRYDPRRALALGYSLIQKEGRLLRSTEGIQKGDRLTLRLARGRLDSQVTGVYNE